MYQHIPTTLPPSPEVRGHCWPLQLQQLGWSSADLAASVECQDKTTELWLRGGGLFTGPPLLHHITANPFKICIVIRFYWILYWYWAVVGLSVFPLLCHPVTFSLLQLLISEHSVLIVCSSQLLTSHCLCVSPHLLVYLLAWKPYHLPLTLFLSLHSFTWPSVGQDGTSRASVNPAEWQDCVHNPLTWLHSCKHTHNVFVECACTHSPWKKCHGGKGQLVFTQTSRRAVTLSAA